MQLTPHIRPATRTTLIRLSFVNRSIGLYQVLRWDPFHYNQQSRRKKRLTEPFNFVYASAPIGTHVTTHLIPSSNLAAFYGPSYVQLRIGQTLLSWVRFHWAIFWSQQSPYFAAHFSRFKLRECDLITHQSIALEMIYQTSFDSDWIGAIDFPQTQRKVFRSLKKGVAQLRFIAPLRPVFAFSICLNLN